MSDDNDIFGHDGRHKPPLTILPAAKYRNELRYISHDVSRQRRMEELQAFAEIFDSPAVFGGDYMYMCGLRYVLETWSLGRIEIDIFRENYLILPQKGHRMKVCQALKSAGYAYNVVGVNGFLNIKRNMI